MLKTFMNQKEIQLGHNTKLTKRAHKCDKIKVVQIISKFQINT